MSNDDENWLIISPVMYEYASGEYVITSSIAYAVNNDY